MLSHRLKITFSPDLCFFIRKSVIVFDVVSALLNPNCIITVILTLIPSNFLSQWFFNTLPNQDQAEELAS